MRTLLLLTLKLCCCLPAFAQLQWAFHAGAGWAYGSVNSRIDNGESQYHINIAPWITPVAGVSLMIPVSRKLCLEPGIQYSKKGFRSIDQFAVHHPVMEAQVMFDTRYYLYYLGIPLTLNYTLLQNDKHRLQLGGGMIYSFLLRGGNDYFSKQTQSGQYMEFEMKNNRIFKGLMQTKDTYYNTMSILDVGVRLQLSYTFRSQLILRLFHEQSLYSVYLKPTSAEQAVKLRYTGISVGFCIPRLKGSIPVSGISGNKNQL